MSANQRGGYPPEVLGFSVNPAIRAADVASDMAYAFGRQVPGGWKVQDAARGLISAQAALDRAAPYVEVMGSYDNPAAQLATDLEEVRSAVEADLLAQNPGMSWERASRSVTPDQVANSLGTLIGSRLFAPEDKPEALSTPLLRDLADVYAKQKFGAEATAADVLKGRLPSATVLKTAAPEILLALGFAPDHPMVASADRGGFLRFAGGIVAGDKMRAITRTPQLLRHVQAALPPSGEQLRHSFAYVRGFLGALSTPQQVHRPN